MLRSFLFHSRLSRRRGGYAPPRARLIAAGLAAVAAVAVLPGTVRAQTATDPCDPAQAGCEFRPPLVDLLVEGAGGTSFSFSGTTQTRAAAVAVQWCDEAALDPASHRVLLDGVVLATTFTPGQKTGCHSYGTTQVTVQLSAGTHTLRAEIRDAATGSVEQPQGNLGYDEAALAYAYTPPPPPDTTTPVYGVSVNAAAPSVPRAAGGAASERFTVRNTGNRPATYTLACAGVNGCAASGASVTVGAGEDATVAVTYRVPAGGAAVWLKAWRTEAASVRDSAQVQVAAAAAAGAGYVGEPGAFSRQDRGLCVAMAAGEGASVECGDLRLAHALPQIRVLGTPRAPTLVYSSQHARPYPVVAAHVAPPAGEAPVRVRAVLRLAGGDTMGGTWAGWAAGTARRVALGFDAAHLPTGVYAYTLEVVAEYASQAPVTLLTRPGSLAVVNRRESAFGAGWWLAGLEQLVFPADTTTRLWVGGDGSTRLYRKTASRTYVADAFDRPDTLYYAGPNYERRLPGGARVVFGSAGRHLRSESALGVATHFVWGDAGRLAEIHLPRGQSFNTGLLYRFEYNNTGTRLSRVLAPGAVEGQPRAVGVTMDAGGRIGWISGPDTTMVGFGYTGADPRVTGRTDRQGALTRFAYGAGSRVESARVPLTAADTAVLAYRPAESQGVQGTAASPADQVFTWVDGPRTDVQDITRFYLDRWGAPVRVRDALGQNTALVARGDARWPGAVTSVRKANGREVTATYDERGQLAAVADWGTVPTHGRPATTVYEWHPVWSAPTRVTAPGGETTLTAYDTLGRPRWTQQGLDASRRVAFGYHDLASATAPGMLHTVTAPDGLTETVEYDARGNVQATVGATGVRTEREMDRIGRLALQKSPDGGWMRPVYDAMDRVVETETFGPATQYAMEPRVVGTDERPAQRLYVHTYYGRTGAVDSVARWQAPDPGGIGRLTTRWRRDLAGRVEAETAPDGAVELMEYDPAGNLTGRRNRRMQWTRTEYDVLGRPRVQRTDAVSYAAVADDRGGLGPAWHFPFFGQDAERNFTQASTPGQGLTLPGDTAYFDYDAVGNLVRADNRDARVRRGYHLDGTLAADTLRIRTYAGQSFDAHVYALGYEYDLDGRRTRLRHPQGIAPTPTATTTEYAYDAVTGALRSVRDPLGLSYGYTYNALGQLTQLDRAPVVETFDYDSAGQPWHRHERVSGTLAHADTLTYDPLSGKTLRAGTRTGVTDLAYTGMGALAWTLTRQRSDLSQAQEEYWTDPLANQIASALTALGPVNPVPERTAHAYQAGTGRLVQSTRYSDDNQAIDGAWSAFDASGNKARFDQWRLVQTPYGASNCTSFWGCAAVGSVPGNLRETALYYYGADERLRVVDRRACLYFAPNTNLPGCDAQHPVSYQYRPTFEEYRYDALGRRVLVRTRSEYMCRYTCLNTLRRIVWDGDQMLYEISAPGGSASDPGARERDTGLQMPAYLGALEQHPGVDRPDGYHGPMAARSFPYGRVMYVHGTGLDAPLALYRMEYSDSLNTPQRVVPQADWRGRYDTGHWGLQWRGDCKLIVVSQTLDPDSTPEHVPGGEDAGRTTRPDLDYWHCLDVDWPAQETWSALQYRPGYYGPRSWMGSLIQDGRDASGQYYRRNRYYDPETGRFTQEDPIGMAGGINLYGFANGDPITYSDPYGLCPPEDLNLLDCPPGFFSAIGAATGGTIGGIGGGISGGGAGALLCAPSGPGALVCGGAGAAAGAVAGAGRGSWLGGRIGAVLDGVILAKRQAAAVADATSLVPQIQSHLEKLGHSPDGRDSNHWRGEIRGWLDQVEQELRHMGRRTATEWRRYIDQARRELDRLSRD